LYVILKDYVPLNFCETVNVRGAIPYLLLNMLQLAKSDYLLRRPLKHGIAVIV